MYTSCGNNPHSHACTTYKSPMRQARRHLASAIRAQLSCPSSTSVRRELIAPRHGWTHQHGHQAIVGQLRCTRAMQGGSHSRGGCHSHRSTTAAATAPLMVLGTKCQSKAGMASSVQMRSPSYSTPFNNEAPAIMPAACDARLLLLLLLQLNSQQMCSQLLILPLPLPAATILPAQVRPHR